MADHVAQAFRDFHEFLSGTRAPALVGQSLATVVVQEPDSVAAAVSAWAYARPHHDRFASLLAARNKVFDIFFYRVVRFRRIYDFFDRFEQALVESVPQSDRPLLSQSLAEAPWREIRPLGSFRDPLEYALEKRRRASVERERFNEDVYRNATHEILSVEKRHTFDDEQTANLVAIYQSQLAGVFDDFLDLIKDPQQRREILLANTADKYAVYAARSRFDMSSYIAHLMEFVIALVNDDFFEHGMQAFGVVRQIHKDFRVDAQSLHGQRFKSQVELINRQKMAEYTSIPARAVLLRSFLPVFEPWGPNQLFQTVMHEEERRARKLAVSLLEAYGQEIYELVVQHLFACNPSTPWYFVRNLAYLLGRIVTGNEPLKHRAVTGLAPHLVVGGVRQLNLQVVGSLGFIGTSEAVNVLVQKLDEFSKHFADRDAAEVCHKIVSTLFGIGTERAVEAAGNFCLARNLVGQYREELARATLPASLRETIVSRVRQEFRKIRITRSLLGNTSAVRSLLTAVGHAGYPEVDALCRDITSALPAQHQLASEAARLLATPPPKPPIAPDRLLHGLLAKTDLPQALCHALDAGTSGRIDVVTREGVACWIDLSHGRVIDAAVSDTLIEDERALFWIALLEPRDIASLRFTPGERAAGAGSIQTPTPDLLREVVFQRAEVRHIVDGIISPESKFSRRDVHPIYTDFSRLEDPEKYVAVWRTLAVEVDMKTIRAETGLSKHDIFRVLLHFHRRNMLSVDGSHRDQGLARAGDALSTIEVYIRRIQQRPLQFRFYSLAAEGCAFLERQPGDEAVKAAARALGGYLLTAYKEHSAFVEENVDVCRRTVDLIAQFHKTRAAVDRQALSDYVSFTFASVSAPVSHDALLSRSALEQLENIAYCNDPFDVVGQDSDERTLEALLAAVHSALSASGVSVDALSQGESPTPTEAKIILELFGDVAGSYTKPIKDFVREVKRTRTAGEPMPAGWLRVIEPSVRLLTRLAADMRCTEVEEIVTRLDRMIAQAMPYVGREVPPVVCEAVLAEHYRLAGLAPLAFGLDLTVDQLAVKQSELLATFVLRQMDGVTDDVMVRLAAASMTTFDAFLDNVPEDIAVAAEVDPRLAEKIFMKFFQYQDLYRHQGDPAQHPKFASMFEIGLTALKEVCVELEKLGGAEQAGKEVDAAQKSRLIASRQRALASLLALLCMRGQYDRVEEVQLAPFEKRVLMLDQYFAELTGEASPPAPTPPSRADAAA
jgi:hypothetical protein